MKPPAGRISEQQVGAPQGGDEVAFRRLVDPHLRGLHAHCYRIVGSAADADDALQETLIKAWRALPAFEGRSAFRSWLYRIATNTCLNMIKRNPKRVLRVDGSAAGDPALEPARPLSESVWLEPLPDDLAEVSPMNLPEVRYDERESVELAFVAALQHLPPRQRAVLILRDVLGFSGTEVADMLDTIPSSVYSLLQRAHLAVEGRIPAISQQETLRALGADRLRDIAERYVDAWERSDTDRLAALLVEDARMAMPPVPTWFDGRRAVVSFLAKRALSAGSRWRLRQTTANSQLAFGCYRWKPADGHFAAHGLQVLTLTTGGQVGELTVFLAERDLTRFGLPERISPS